MDVSSYHFLVLIECHQPVQSTPPKPYSRVSPPLHADHSILGAQVRMLTCIDPFHKYRTDAFFVGTLYDDRKVTYSAIN